MRRIRGFSMIELMVAVVLALIVTAAVLAVFVASRQSFNSTSGTAALADGGRFALDFIQNSVRSAGYMACNTTQRQISILQTAPSPMVANFTQALTGYEANNTAPGGAFTATASPVSADPSTLDWSSPSGVAPAGLDAALASKVIKNNDVLVVYSTLRNAQSSYVTAIAPGASTFTVNAPGSLVNGQLASISDCAKSVVMWVTSVSANTVSFSSGTWPNNNVSSFPVSFGVGSQVTPVDTTVFYIGQGADGDSALFSLDLNAGTNSPAGTFAATELVPDIEAMQVLYGLDTTGSQTVSQYVTADHVVNTLSSPATNFNNVMSVKVAVLAASQPGALPKATVASTYNLLGTIVTAPLDNRARQVFELTIGLRNLAP